MKRVKVVFSGSGTLYPAHVGAVARLFEAGYTFEAVAGTSGGCIVAAGLASGYKPNAELIEMIKRTLPSKNNLIDPSILALFIKWGFIKGDKIEKVLDKYLVKTIGEAKIPFYGVTTNITKRKMRIFSSEKDSKMSMSKVVRASLSIPGVFVPVEIEDDLYIDGGITGNFMIDLFGDSDNVIGIKFTSASSEAKPIKNAFDYTNAVIDTMLQANADERIEDVLNPNIITIHSKYSNMNFNMPESEAMDLVLEGYTAADQWIKARI